MRRWWSVLGLVALVGACGEEEKDGPPPNGAPPDPVAREAINDYRALMGLPPVADEQHLTAAAKAHVDYYLGSIGVDEACAGGTISPHDEVAGCPGFTGQAPWDRAAAAGYPSQGVGECIHFVNDPELSVYDWLISVYHRFCIAAPEVTHVGYAAGRKALGGFSIDVLDVGNASSADAAHVARWPVPDAADVPKAWDGLENPQPPPPPGGYPSGPIVGVIYPPQDDVEITSATLSHSTGNVPSTFIHPGNDPHLGGSNGFFLYSDLPLVERRTYDVRFFGTRDGATLNDTWSFSVPCDGSLPSVGKACAGNTLLACNMNTPIETPCGDATCLEYVSGARCHSGAIVPCAAPDGAFLRCDTNQIITCVGGYELVTRDCGVDVCLVGAQGPTCAISPDATCTSTEPERLRCEGELLVVCDQGYLQHQSCGAGLYCQVNSTGTRGFCGAARPMCSAARCAGEVPIDCVDGYEVAEPICAAPTSCAAADLDATCTD